MELYQNPNHLTSFIAEHLEIIAKTSKFKICNLQFTNSNFEPQNPN